MPSPTVWDLVLSGQTAGKMISLWYREQMDKEFPVRTLAGQSAHEGHMRGRLTQVTGLSELACLSWDTGSLPPICRARCHSVNKIERKETE